MLWRCSEVQRDVWHIALQACVARRARQTADACSAGPVAAGIHTRRIAATGGERERLGLAADSDSLLRSATTTRVVNETMSATKREHASGVGGPRPTRSPISAPSNCSLHSKPLSDNRAAAHTSCSRRQGPPRWASWSSRHGRSGGSILRFVAAAARCCLPRTNGTKA